MQRLGTPNRYGPSPFNPAPGALVPGGPSAYAPPEAGPPRSSSRRPMILDVAPHVEHFRASWQRIARPGSGTFNPVANVPCVYIVRRLRVPDDTGGQEIAYVGAEFDLAPTDYNGVGIADDEGGGVAAYNSVTPAADSALPWGDATGRTAAMIVAVNLAGQPNTWYQQELPLLINDPGVSQLDSSRDAMSQPRQESSILDYAKFPPGSFAGGPSNPSQRYPFSRRIGLYRIPSGSTLDIAFVMRSSQFRAAPAASRLQICGHNFVTALYIGSQPLTVLGS